MSLQHQHSANHSKNDNKWQNAVFPVLEFRKIYRHDVGEHKNERYLQKLRRLELDKTEVYPPPCIGGLRAHKQRCNTHAKNNYESQIYDFCVLEKMIIEHRKQQHCSDAYTTCKRLTFQIICSVACVRKSPAVGCREHHYKPEHHQHHYQHKKRLIYLGENKSEIKLFSCLRNRLIDRGSVIIIDIILYICCVSQFYSSRKDLYTKFYFSIYSKVCCPHKMHTQTFPQHLKAS